MAMYLGNKKVAVTNTIEKQVPSMKGFFDAGGKCNSNDATSFEGCWQYDDTANVTNMYDMFGNNRKLLSIPPLNTSSATNMQRMFYSCRLIKKIPEIDTSKVTTMQDMFYYCSNITEIPPLKTSKVTDMRDMFHDCTKLVIAPLMDDTSNVTRMDHMFDGCSCKKIKEIPNFDMTNVTNADYIFSSCYSLEKIHMININTNLGIYSSTNFTREALLEIIGNLKAQTSGTKTLEMGSKNLAKLTDEDKAIATNKGWTLA